MRTAGIVVAGGLSRRFGSPKAFARVGNKTFYEIAVDALQSVCDEVIIVTRPELVSRHKVGEKVMTDLREFAGLGPLAGILSAMESVEADRYVVLPCDMPNIDGEVIRQLLDRHMKGITAVHSGGQQHPLVSVWDCEMKAAIRQALKRNRLSVINLLEKLDVTWIADHKLAENAEFVFTNVNTPDVLER